MKKFKVLAILTVLALSLQQAAVFAEDTVQTTTEGDSVVTDNVVSETPEKAKKPEKAEKAEKPEKVEKPEKQDNTGKSGNDKNGSIFEDIKNTVKSTFDEVKKEYKEKKLEAKEYISEIKDSFAEADKEMRKEILSQIAEVKKELKDSSIGVFVKGHDVDFGKYDNVLPKIVKDRTLVPIRAITEALGATVEWDGETGKITISKDGNEIILTLGSNEVIVNGEVIEYDTAPELENDRTMVPIRIIAEALGAVVDWDEDSHTITIEEKKDADTEETVDADNETEATEEPEATEAPEVTEAPEETEEPAATEEPEEETEIEENTEN